MIQRNTPHSFAEARPEKLARIVLAEPIDVENLRRRLSLAPTLIQCAQ